MTLVEITGKQYELKYNFNAICALEEATGKALWDLLQTDSAKFLSVRALFWAGLLHKFNGSMDFAGDLLQAYISEGGSVLEIFEKIGSALIDAGIIKTQKKEVETSDQGEQ